MPEGHTAEMSFLSVEGLAVGSGMPTGGLLNDGVRLASETFVVSAPTKDLIA